MADLDFLAGSVKEAPAWDRDESATNPLYAHVEKSWLNRSEVGRGKQAREVGSPLELQLTSYDNLKRVKKALYDAAEAYRDEDAPNGLGLSLRYFGPPAEAGNDATREKIRAIKNEDEWKADSGGDVLLRFRAKPFKSADDAEGESVADEPREDDDENGDDE
jgi:hypothetical protein